MPLPSVIYDVTDVFGTSATPAGTAKGGSRPDQGMLLLDDKLNKLYVFVKNIRAATVAVSDPGTYDIATNGNKFEVTQPTTATLDAFAGAWQGAAVQNGFGWVQVYGDSKGNVDGTVAIAAGDALKGVNATSAMVKDTAAGTTPTYHRYARIYAAYAVAAAAVKPCFIYALG